MKAQWIEFNIPMPKYLPSGRKSPKPQIIPAKGAAFTYELGGQKLHFVVQTERAGEKLHAPLLVHFESGRVISRDISWMQTRHMLDHGTNAKPLPMGKAAVMALEERYP